MINRNNIAVFFGIMPIAVFVFWQLTQWLSGKYYNEIFITTVSIALSGAFGLLYKITEGHNRKALILLTSVFYGTLALIYVGRWIFCGEPTTNYVKALFIGMVIAAISWIYDNIKYRRLHSKR